MADVYLTRQGDTWDVIAYRLWGRETLMQALIAANPDHGDVVVFGPDVPLTVPVLTVPARRPDLPPWMHGMTGMTGMTGMSGGVL